MKFKIGNNISINTYNSLQDIPITNFNEFQYYYLMANNIKPKISEIQSLVSRANLFLAEDKDYKQEITKILFNIGQSAGFATMDVYPIRLAFACLIVGKNKDFGIENLQYKVDHLAMLGITEKQIIDCVQKFNENVNNDFEYLLNYENTPQDAHVLRDLIYAKCQKVILQTDDLNGKIMQFKEMFLEKYKVISFVDDNANSIVYSHQRDFINLCIDLQNHSNTDVKTLKAIDFFMLLQRIKDKNNKQK